MPPYRGSITYTLPGSTLPKSISFATQKGGSGKSTLALVLTAPLATEYGLNMRSWMVITSKASSTPGRT